MTTTMPDTTIPAPPASGPAMKADTLAILTTIAALAARLPAPHPDLLLGNGRAQYDAISALPGAVMTKHRRVPNSEDTTIIHNAIVRVGSLEVRAHYLTREGVEVRS